MNGRSVPASWVTTNCSAVSRLRRASLLKSPLLNSLPFVLAASSMAALFMPLRYPVTQSRHDHLDREASSSDGCCPSVRIDIWSDIVCPWCYLGAHRLQAALDIVGRDDIDVRWHAFQLDPNAPLEAGDMRTRLESKYGAGSFDSMTSRLVALGKAEGLDYQFDKALSPNTLMHTAWSPGPMTPVAPQPRTLW